MTKSLRIFFVSALIMVLALTAGCREKADFTEFQVLDKTFYFPKGYSFYMYSAERQHAEFGLDVNTFTPIKKGQGLKDRRSLSVEVRAVGSAWGKEKFWTRDDPIFKAVPDSCENVKYQSHEYSLCDYSENRNFVFGMQHAFSIKEKGKSDYFSIYGCSDTPSDNAVCAGRMRIADNIQIEYVFYKIHLARAVEIAHEVQKLSLELLSPPSSDKNDLSAKSD